MQPITSGAKAQEVMLLSNGTAEAGAPPYTFLTTFFRKLRSRGFHLEFRRALPRRDFPCSCGLLWARFSERELHLQIDASTVSLRAEGAAAEAAALCACQRD